ncbi:hypothetical protein SPX_34860 [Sporomusa paucivorans]
MELIVSLITYTMLHAHDLDISSVHLKQPVTAASVKTDVKYGVAIIAAVQF